MDRTSLGSEWEKGTNHDINVGKTQEDLKFASICVRRDGTAQKGLNVRKKGSKIVVIPDRKTKGEDS